jgi:hypothetical protein
MVQTEQEQQKSELPRDAPNQSTQKKKDAEMKIENGNMNFKGNNNQVIQGQSRGGLDISQLNVKIGDVDFSGDNNTIAVGNTLIINYNQSPNQGGKEGEKSSPASSNINTTMAI